MVQKQQVYKSKTYMIDYNAGSQYKFISYEGRKIEILDKENNRIAFIKDIPDVLQIELISDTKAIMKSNRLMYAVYDVACMDFTWKYQYKPNPVAALSKFVLAGSNIILDYDPNNSDRNPRKERMFRLDFPETQITTCRDLVIDDFLQCCCMKDEFHILNMNVYGIMSCVDIRDMTVQTVFNAKKQWPFLHNYLSLHPCGYFWGSVLEKPSENIYAVLLNYLDPSEKPVLIKNDEITKVYCNGSEFSRSGRYSTINYHSNIDWKESYLLIFDNHKKEVLYTERIYDTSIWKMRWIGEDLYVILHEDHCSLLMKYQITED